MKLLKSVFPGCSIAYTTVQDGRMADHKTVSRVFKRIDNSCKTIVVPKLQHGSKCAVIKSSRPLEPACDAMITNSSKISLAIRVCDCLPIVLWDSKSRALGLVHGGWRSLLQNIIPLTIQKMQIAYGVAPKNLHIWIGPSLHNCCNVMANAEVHEWFHEWKKYITEVDGKIHLNLQDAVRDQCMEYGILAKRIQDCGRCTYHEAEKFFSYRRARNAGQIEKFPHIAIMAWMEKPAMVQ